jgi:hypothetical protein
MITRSLEIVPLGSLSTLPKLQNYLLDTVAIISWVSPQTVKRVLGLKRDIHLVHPSTARKVIMSVFTDAENFTPEVGTVALFRNLRNHKFDGGSLNAYQEDCKVWKWFLPDPTGHLGPEEVERLKEWWAQQQHASA